MCAGTVRCAGAAAAVGTALLLQLVLPWSVTLKWPLRLWGSQLDNLETGQVIGGDDDARAAGPSCGRSLLQFTGASPRSAAALTPAKRAWGLSEETAAGGLEARSGLTVLDLMPISGHMRLLAMLILLSALLVVGLLCYWWFHQRTDDGVGSAKRERGSFCPGLVVPQSSECVLMVPVIAGAGASGDTSADVHDKGGVAAATCLRPPLDDTDDTSFASYKVRVVGGEPVIEVEVMKPEGKASRGAGSEAAAVDAAIDASVAAVCSVATDVAVGASPASMPPLGPRPALKIWLSPPCPESTAAPKLLAVCSAGNKGESGPSMLLYGEAQWQQQLQILGHSGGGGGTDNAAAAKAFAEEAGAGACARLSRAGPRSPRGSAGEFTSLEYELNGPYDGLPLLVCREIPGCAVTVTDAQGECLACAEPMDGDTMITNAPRSSSETEYKLRVSSGSDVGLMLCALLAMDFMEG